ncbi:MAG: 1,4-dihydroxy-6-naphthoate synthase [Planctomycetaceae bacterium]|nr:1,4-dihydroxy-6-naphthoate synthase [Planctomycetaceae bacterium]
MTTIQLGISTCPNDTFAFHGLMTGEVDLRGLQFDVSLIDIQQLNDRLFAGDFDVAKTSFHAALLLSEQMIVLPSGSALGFGVGPLLLSCEPGIRPTSQNQLTLCPGQHTTAALLYRLFYGDTARIEHVVFSEIMPCLQNRSADFGVCIHEGRFTWQNEGLGLVEDLGTRWENETSCPLPLGGIVARRSLPEETLQTVQSVIRDSLLYAQSNPAAALPTMRRYAQEFDDDVLMKHVDLYVNDWTIDLGDVGRNALSELFRRAAGLKIVAPNARPLEVLHQG